MAADLPVGYFILVLVLVLHFDSNRILYTIPVTVVLVITIYITPIAISVIDNTYPTQ